MLSKATRLVSLGFLLGICVFNADVMVSQEPPPYVPSPGEIPKGVEVQARGPIHEAFAAPLTEARPTPLIGKKPPLPIEEMPPDERPEGDVVWIGGYFAWDDDRADFLWVSGCWRIKPQGKEWVPGYWREVGDSWQWAPGFWAATQVQAGPQAPQAQPVTYYPEPPAPPQVAPAGDPPAVDTFHIPGYWMWNGDRYVWRAGYWTRVRPGYVYVASHYRWTPYGYVFVVGYWDLTIARRGVLYAPIVIDPLIVGPRYVYTPYYAVRDTIVLDTLFVRPAFGAYYFGDYYGPRYVAIGFQPGVIYSRQHYEPIIAYQRWTYRDNPRWHDTQITLVIERNAGRAPVPPRTVNFTHVTNVTNITNVKNVTNVTNINNVVGPTRTVLASQGQKAVKLDNTTRAHVRQTSQAAQQTLAADRRNLESTVHKGPATAPRTTSLHVPTVPSAHTPPGVGGIGGPKTIGKTPANPPFAKPGPAEIHKGPIPPNFKGKTPHPSDPRGPVPGVNTTPSKGGPVVRPPEAKRTPEDTKKKKGP